MIRGVTVDWWHTVAEPPGEDWEAYAKRARCEGIQSVLKEHGIVCTHARLDIAYDLWTDHLARLWKRGMDMSAEQQIMDLLGAAGFDGVAEPSLLDDLKSPIGAPLLLRPPALHEGVLDALRALKARGLHLAMISNTGRTWGAFLRQVQERLGLGDVFDTRTFSDETRVRKPGPAIFKHTLAALRLPPETVAHVGDDVDADIAGARAMGMRAIWYDTGFWKGAATSQADAVIHTWRELPDLVESWRR